jgi:hypothetical protein
MFRSLRSFLQALSAPHATGRPRRVRPTVEALEDRNLLSIVNFGITSVTGFHSYVGVGFRRQPVAVVDVTTDTEEVVDPNAIQVQINYNDSSGWQPAELSLPSHTGHNTEFVVKGTHTYQQPGPEEIEVRVSAGGLAPQSKPTCSDVAYYLPSAASLPGQEPPVLRVYPPPSPETLGTTGVDNPHVAVGDGSSTMQIGWLDGELNGVSDPNPADYLVQINWGDSPAWTTGQVVANPDPSGPAFILQGSHPYGQAGNYPVVVYVTGPTGQTRSDQVTVVTAFNPPDQVQFSTAGYTVAENGGSAVITVTRTGDTSGQASVSYATRDDTARAGIDYTPVSGQLVFGPGETSKTFTVPVRDRGLTSGTATVSLTLGNPTGGATLGSPQTVVLTIYDNDAPSPPPPPGSPSGDDGAGHYLPVSNVEGPHLLPELRNWVTRQGAELLLKVAKKDLAANKRELAARRLYRRLHPRTADRTVWGSQTAIAAFAQAIRNEEADIAVAEGAMQVADYAEAVTYLGAINAVLGFASKYVDPQQAVKAGGKALNNVTPVGAATNILNSEFNQLFNSFPQ